MHARPIMLFVFYAATAAKRKAAGLEPARLLNTSAVQRSGDGALIATSTSRLSNTSAVQRSGDGARAATSTSR